MQLGARAKSAASPRFAGAAAPEAAPAVEAPAAAGIEADATESVLMHLKLCGHHQVTEALG